MGFHSDQVNVKTGRGFIPVPFLLFSSQIRIQVLRRTADQRATPQVPPVLHEAAELAPKEKPPPPERREANVDIFLLTCVLPHTGQVTSCTALALRTSSSNGRLQSPHTNSNRGINHSYDQDVWFFILCLDAQLIRWLHLELQAEIIIDPHWYPSCTSQRDMKSDFISHMPGR
jgi:hypothetical protein